MEAGKDIASVGVGGWDDRNPIFGENFGGRDPDISAPPASEGDQEDYTA